MNHISPRAKERKVRGAIASGGCLCGGVRFHLQEELWDLCDCHCIDCRRASGAAFVTWGTVACDKLQMEKGDVRTVRFAGRVRSFAACCGTTLFFKASDEVATIDVTIASLDEPERFPPQTAIWTEDQVPWVALDPGRRQ